MPAKRNGAFGSPGVSPSISLRFVQPRADSVVSSRSPLSQSSLGQFILSELTPRQFPKQRRRAPIKESFPMSRRVTFLTTICAAIAFVGVNSETSVFAQSSTTVPAVASVSTTSTTVAPTGTTGTTGTKPTIAKTWNVVNLAFMHSNITGIDRFKQVAYYEWSTDAFVNDAIFGNWYGSAFQAFTQFDPALFAGKTITKATLNLLISSCGNGVSGDEYSQPIHVHQLTSSYFSGQRYGRATSIGDSSTYVGSEQHAVVDVTAIAKTWSDKTKNYGLMFDMASATNSFCRMGRTNSAGEFSSIEITYADQPQFLSNPSFEAGKAAWNRCYNPKMINLAMIDGTSVNEGAKLMRFNSSVGDGSVCQTKPWRPRAGDQYQLAVRVRSAPGKPINGTASLWEVRDAKYGPSQNAHVDFVATSEWKEFRTTACAANGEATELRTEIYVGTANENLDVDYARVSIANPSICSGAVATSIATAVPTTPPTTQPTTPPTTPGIK